MVEMRMSRGIEKVIALAALDSEFSRKLLTNREAAIDSCDIELSESERAILLAIPNMQLDHAINNVKVPSEARRQFLKGAVIAAVTLVIGSCLFLSTATSLGIRPGSRRFDNAVTIATLRNIGAMQDTYQEQHGCYAGTIKELAVFLDKQEEYEGMASGKKSNYLYEFSNVTNDSYQLRAIPQKKDRRFFFIDQTGTIRYSEGPEVGPESKKLGE